MTAKRPRPRRRWMLPALIAATLIIGLVSWWKFKPEPPPPLATTAAQRADLESNVVATGALEAAQMVSVGAQVSGRVESLKVELGQIVKTGDLIAEIDSTTQQNAVKNAQAALNSAQAQRIAHLATLKQSELAFNRQKTMIAKEATSQAEFENAETALNAARAQLKVIEAQIAQSETSLSTAKANLGYTQITAPMDGTVVAIVTKEGQTVNANQSAPTIVKLAKLDTMLVKAEVSEADVVKVQAGQTVYFTILGNPHKRYYATLHSVEPAPESIINENTQASSTNSAVYYNALFEVPNPDGELRISMTAEVYIVLAEAKNAVTIPSAAIERGPGGKATVMVVGPDGKPSPREVTVGIDNSAVAEIIEGVNEGEHVVLGQGRAPGAAAAGARPNPGMRRMF